MRLSDHLSSENVAIDLKAASKQDLLMKLADLASRKTGLQPALIYRALETRERLGSTGIGRGIAMPHAVVPGLFDSHCMLVRLSKPLDFDAIDDVPVDIVVLLLSPSAEKGQSLNILSCVARSLRDERVVSAVRAADTAERAYSLVTKGGSDSIVPRSAMG